MDLKLNEKVAIVTGGAKGIGRAIVNCLVAENAKVVFADLDSTASENLVVDLVEMFGDAIRDNVSFIIGDLSDESNCQQIVNRTVEQFGKIDILINNAGFNDSTGFCCSEATFLESLQKNLVQVFSVTKFASNELKKNEGSIVNVSSKVSVTGQGGTTGYAAAKGAVNALTREWAVELADWNVNVNTVLPAECWTASYAKWIESQSNPEAANKEIGDLVPLGKRFTNAEEIADAVVFLASPRSSHTTGQLLFVDGGYTHLDRKLSAKMNIHWTGN